MPDRDAKVLIVAPGEYDAGLPLQPLPHSVEEIAELIRSFYRPIPLTGRVTSRMVSDELREGIDGFYFIGHALSGPSGGFALSNGIISSRDIGRYLAAGDVRWSYLNTCDSGALVEALQAVHAHDIYANITPSIDDKEAANNGILLAQGIADTGSIVTAYRRVVKGGESKLRYFPSPAIGANVINREQREPPSGANMDWRLLDLAAQVRELTKDLDNLPARVTRLEGMEVVVRPAVPEVVIRPAIGPESVNLSVRMLFAILIIALLVVVVLIVALVWLRLTNG